MTSSNRLFLFDKHSTKPHIEFGTIREKQQNLTVENQEPANV